MPKQGTNEINTQQFSRNFFQQGAARPGNAVRYAGLDTEYMIITGLTVSDKGSVDIQYAPDPVRPGALRRVATTHGQPDPSEATLQLTEKHGKIPWFHYQQYCPFNVYQFAGTQCVDLTDTANGWDNYVRILSNAEVSSKDFGALQAWEDDGQNTVDLSVTLGSVQTVGRLSFGEKATSTVTANVADIVFGKQVRCGDCGVPNDGTRFIYAVQDGISSPATKPAVIYSVDYGATWVSQSVTTAANAETIKAIEIVGNYLVLLSATGGASLASCLYVSQLNTVTGVPSTTYTKVTPAVFNPTNISFDMFALSQSEVFFAAAGGYVYKSTDILNDMTLVSAGDATTVTLQRIHGVEDTIVIVGQSGVVIKSTNRGSTFSVTTTNPGAGSNSAVAVLDQYRYWVGNLSGALYYTLDGGETWTAKTFTAGTPIAVQDIQFASDEVGVLSYTTAGPVARIATTIFGGQSWWDSATTTKRLGTVTAAATYNRVAFPSSGDGTTTINTVALGGLGTGTDGVISLGVAAHS